MAGSRWVPPRLARSRRPNSGNGEQRWWHGLATSQSKFVTVVFSEEDSVMPSREEIYSKVSATLVEALNVDEEDIRPSSTLQGDLGAESIDFLDIVFRLEREFGIKIPRGELFPESIFQGDPEFVQDGRVT